MTLFNFRHGFRMEISIHDRFCHVGGVNAFSAVLHNDADGDLGIVVRGVGDQRNIIHVIFVAVRQIGLGRSRFAAIGIS